MGMFHISTHIRSISLYLLLIKMKGDKAMRGLALDNGMHFVSYLQIQNLTLETVLAESEVHPGNHCLRGSQKGCCMHTGEGTHMHKSCENRGTSETARDAGTVTKCICYQDNLAWRGERRLHSPRRKAQASRLGPGPCLRKCQGRPMPTRSLGTKPCSCHSRPGLLCHYCSGPWGVERCEYLQSPISPWAQALALWVCLLASSRSLGLRLPGSPRHSGLTVD